MRDRKAYLTLSPIVEARNVHVTIHLKTLCDMLDDPVGFRVECRDEFIEEVRQFLEREYGQAAIPGSEAPQGVADEEPDGSATLVRGD